MPVFELRAVLPFSLEEFDRGLRYTQVRHSALVAAHSRNGEKVTTLEKRNIEPSRASRAQLPEELARHGRIPDRHLYYSAGGTFTKNEIDLASRFPAWLPLRKEWLLVHEAYYYSYPYSFCSYSLPAAPGALMFTIESLHVAEDPRNKSAIATREDIFAEESTEERRARRPVQYIDVTEPVAPEITGAVFMGKPHETAVFPGRHGHSMLPLPATVGGRVRTTWSTSCASTNG